MPMILEQPKSLIFNLSDISGWQLDYQTSRVELPAMQRGFVWKVNQIEALWDSILRGYPIGAFLLSKTEDNKLFLLDGQQRATSIALGYYNPWILENDTKFWSLKSIPTVWIDLNPKERTPTQKYVIRVVTQSHPWGYQRSNPNSVLSISDRRTALKNLRQIDGNKEKGYIHFPAVSRYPHDADMPIPLSFVIKAVNESGNWKLQLLNLAKKFLPYSLTTKYFDGSKDYFKRLEETLISSPFNDDLHIAVKNLSRVQIPGVVVEREVLRCEDADAGDDPTLFVRLNSAGTKIAGEELIYSIYKASFPEAKDLVENIGANFVPPSMVISLVSRLAWAEINEGSYPYPLNVNEFRKRINNASFKDRLRKMIGSAPDDSEAKTLFSKAFDVLLSPNEICTPAVLVKKLVRDSPDLFLMLLQWLKQSNTHENSLVNKRVLATVTTLSWFAKNTSKYVRDLWDRIPDDNFWTKEVLSTPFIAKRNPIIFPIIQPELLRDYLLSEVAVNNVLWDNLYPQPESILFKTLATAINSEPVEEDESRSLVHEIWDRFIGNLFSCRSLVLFVQRQYLNDRFGDYNQMETLEDTNAPWDWDHIYPTSWVYGKWYINRNTKHWTNCIGNLRAMSLEENRSESNSLSPKQRLQHVKTESFILPNDWAYWKTIESRINSDNETMIKNHLNAIIHRFCNLYERWYSELEIKELFSHEAKVSFATV